MDEASSEQAGAETTEEREVGVSTFQLAKDDFGALKFRGEGPAE